MIPRGDARTRPICVAIVDDETSVRVALHRLCKVFGLVPSAYASGQEFIRSLDSGLPRPDCLLLDAQMPEMTGLEVQRHLADRAIRLPVVVLTADDAPEVRARYAAAGAAEYLRKPVSGADLIAAIESVVRNQSSDCRPPPPSDRQGGE